MAVIDSYSEANKDSESGVLSTGGFTTRWAQCFTGDGQKIVDAKWYGLKSNSPTGNIVAKIYAMSGTYGTSGIATGSALATSDNVDISTISTGMALVTFTFSGANQYTTTNGTKYVLSAEYTGGGAGVGFVIGYDASSPTHAGNVCYWDGSVWQPISSVDFCFYVDGIAAGGGGATGQFLGFF